MGSSAHSWDVLTTVSERSFERLAVTADSMRRPYLGRHVLGLTAVGLGVITLVWHDFGAPWQQIGALRTFRSAGNARFVETLDSFQRHAICFRV